MCTYGDWLGLHAFGALMIDRGESLHPRSPSECTVILACPPTLNTPCNQKRKNPTNNPHCWERETQRDFTLVWFWTLLHLRRAMAVLNACSWLVWSTWKLPKISSTKRNNDKIRHDEVCVRMLVSHHRPPSSMATSSGRVAGGHVRGSKDPSAGDHFQRVPMHIRV